MKRLNFNRGTLAVASVLLATAVSAGVSGASASASFVTRPMTTCEVIASSIARDQTKLLAHQEALANAIPGTPTYTMLVNLIHYDQVALDRDQALYVAKNCVQ